MPLYEYKCHKCGKEFEVLRKFSDAPLETHAGCGGIVEQLLSASAFHFKGSGFYITDYGRKNGSSANGKSDNGKNENGSASPSKSESAPAKPAESKPSTTSEPAAKS